MCDTVITLGMFLQGGGSLLFVNEIFIFYLCVESSYGYFIPLIHFVVSGEEDYWNELLEPCLVFEVDDINYFRYRLLQRFFDYADLFRCNLCKFLQN